MNHLGLFMGAVLACMATAQAKELAPTTPAKDLIGDWSFEVNPDLPNVLLIGDSISIGYTLPVRKLLQGRANIFRPMRPSGKFPENCGDTPRGLAHLNEWLGDRHWDAIHFNWGLWDLCYRNPESKAQGNRDKVNGKLSVPPEKYERNLEQLVTRLKATGAKLVWADTTVVPQGEVGRIEGDDVKYNAIAARVMKRHDIPTNDLHALTRSFDGKFFVGPGDVHYTAMGYQKIAEQVAKQISAALVNAK